MRTQKLSCIIDINKLNISKLNIICETKSVYILLAFLLIAVSLLIVVSFYCHLIKYKANQKHLLPFYVTNNEKAKMS